MTCKKYGTLPSGDMQFSCASKCIVDMNTSHILKASYEES
jgi:hypothetical protein